MKRRPYRLLNIAVIFVALTVAVASVWWREHVGPSPLASLGGLIGLIGVLLFQAFYDTQSEMAFAAVNARVDLQERRLADQDRHISDQARHIAALESRLAALERSVSEGGPA